MRVLQSTTLLIGLLLSGITEADASSEKNRKKQFVQLLAEPGGAIDGLPSKGMRLGLFLTDDLVLQASANVMDITFVHYNAYSQLATLDLKYFVGNSFYIEAGGGVKRQGLRYYPMVRDETGNYVHSEELYEFSMTQAGYHYAFGNQWQWESFSMGVEWIGVFKPLEIIERNETIENFDDPWFGAVEYDLGYIYRAEKSLQVMRYMIGFGF